MTYGKQKGLYQEYFTKFENYLENAITHKNFVPAAQENPLAAVLLSQLKVRYSI